ncbi:MAG: transcriptional regulator [Fimbriimonadaceae bacterium]|nr:transcriptional regulator [Chitinophagales bacterium]
MLKPIRKKNEYEESLERIYSLIQKGAKRSEKETDELEILSILAKEYEQKHFPVPPPHPLEAIKFRLEQLGMKESELNNLFGNRSRKSDILNGKRKLSIRMIRLLHDKLKIPAETLIADY